ncbi:MAG TPA: MerR family transcriptional regulator [Bacteroidia bacterium]
MPYKEIPSQELKIYYPIGEVAEMLDVSVSLIRYWEKEFDVLNPTRNKKGNRFFTKKDLEIIKRIHHLVKVQGLTLDGAKKWLEENEQKEAKRFQLVQRLENIKSELENLRKIVE